MADVLHVYYDIFRFRLWLGLELKFSFFRAGAVALVVFATAVLSGPASAAQPYTWTGFYVGGNIGFRASEAAWTVRNAIVPMSYDYSSIGVRGGLYAGYNWQFAPRWVTGVEADIGFGDHETRQVNFFPGGGGVFGPLLPGDFSAIKLKWDGSLRARLGYLVTPSTMLFGMAGVAWQQVELNLLCVSFFLCAPDAGHGETIRPGWTVGGGIETALTGNWFARAEYRYASFGTFNLPLTFIGTTSGVPIEVATHTATFGLTYRFGANGSPPPAWPEDAATMYRWAGLHLGASTGARFGQAHWETKSVGALPLDDTNWANYNGVAFHGAFLVGYDWQIADRWIAGLETDVGVGSRTTILSGFLPGLSGSTPGGPIFPGDESSVRTNWDASIRARLGYLLRPSLLVYGTGGIAWMRVEANSTCGAATCLTVESSTDAQTLTGWTIGGGAETKLSRNWRARAEYRYADFGTMHANFSYFSIPAAEVDIRVRTHTGQFALIYDLN